MSTELICYRKQPCRKVGNPATRLPRSTPCEPYLLPLHCWPRV